MNTKRTETASSTTRRRPPPRASAGKRARKAVPIDAANPDSAPEPPLVVDEVAGIDTIAASDAALEPPLADDAADAVVDPDLRHRMISEAAYRRYAERNFADGYDLDDWLQAEAEVGSLLHGPRRS